jgi:NitT/TauT family transport system substrate-binding protein
MASDSPPATTRGLSRLRPRRVQGPLCLLVLLLVVACSPAAAPSSAPKPPAQPATPVSPAASQASTPAAAPSAAPAAAPAPAKPAQAVTVRVGMLPTNLGNAGFLVAAARGYLAEQGITAETQNFDGGTRMVPPLAQGELEVGMGGLGAALYNAITRDIPMKIVADNGSTPPGHGWQGLAVRKELADGGLRTLADLKGKNVGLSSLASSGEVTYYKILERTGLSDQDLTIELLAFPDQVVALGNGRLDSALLIEPLLTTALDNGTAVLLAGVDDINPGQQLAGVMYSARFIQQSPDAARAFMVGYVKGIRDYLDAVGPRKKDQDQVFGILANAGLVRDPAQLPRLRPVGFDPDGRVNARSLDEDQDVYLRQGHQQERINMAQVIDNTFVDHAARVLGPYQR